MSSNFSKTKKLEYCFTFLQISFIVGLIEEGSLLSASAFNLVWNVALVEIYKENEASYKQKIGRIF